MRRCQRIEKVAFDRKLALCRVKLRPRDQKDVFRALPKRQNLRSVDFDLVLREHTGDRVEQSEPIGGDNR